MHTTQCPCCNSRCKTFRDSLSIKGDPALFASHPGAPTDPIELHYLSDTLLRASREVLRPGIIDCPNNPVQVHALIHWRAHRLRNLYTVTIDLSKIRKTEWICPQQAILWSSGINLAVFFPTIFFFFSRSVIMYKITIYDFHRFMNRAWLEQISCATLNLVARSLKLFKELTSMI